MNLRNTTLEELLSSKKLDLITNTKGLSNYTSLNIFEITNNGEVYFFGNFPESHLRQIHLNPEVQLVIKESMLIADGQAYFVKDKKTIQKKLMLLIEKGLKLPSKIEELPPTTKLVIVKLYMIKRIDLNGKVIEHYEIPNNRNSLFKEIIFGFGNELKYWFFAARAPFFTASLIPILVGTSAAYFVKKTIRWELLFLALIGLLFIHAATNLLNDYYDHVSKNDDINKFFTPFNGGSRFIQSRLATPARIFVAGIFSLFAGIAIGLYLNTIYPGNIILFIGILGVYFAIFYTAPPFNLSYRTLGDLAVGIGFGPLPVIGAFYLQTGTLEISTAKYALISSIPVGILVALILYVNNFQDLDADTAVNKKTSIVKLGKSRAAKLYPWILAIVYIIIMIGIIFGMLPYTMLIVFLTVPLAINAVKGMKTMYSKVFELIPVNITTINLHLFTGLLISIGFIIAGYFGLGTVKAL